MVLAPLFPFCGRQSVHSQYKTPWFGCVGEGVSALFQGPRLHSDRGAGRRLKTGQRRLRVFSDMDHGAFAVDQSLQCAELVRAGGTVSVAVVWQHRLAVQHLQRRAPVSGGQHDSVWRNHIINLLQRRTQRWPISNKRSP